MFYCFNCGQKLIELGMGAYVCSNCGSEYIPYLDKDEQQCMCNYLARESAFTAKTLRSSSTLPNISNTPKR